MRSAYFSPIFLVLLYVAPCYQASKLFGATHEVTIDKDINDLRDYSPQEVQALKELKEMKKSRSFIFKFLPPRCNFHSWTEGSCCIKFKWQNKKKTVCISAELLIYEAVLRIGLLWNHDILFEHDIALAKFCIGVPLLSKIKVCLHVYHLDIDLKVKPKFLRICARFTIFSMELRLNCMTIIDGKKVKFDDLIEPDEDGIFLLNFKHGRVVFEFNNPLPPELVKSLKNMGKFIKSKFVQLGKKIYKTVKYAWKQLKKWFAWWW